MSHAVHPKNLSNWITIHDSKASFDVAFPSQPIEMSFDLPFQNTPSTGSLHIYSVPLEKGVIILSVLQSPKVNDKILKEEAFKDCVDTYLVKVLFQEPTIFHQQQVFKSRQEQHGDLSLLGFQFSYRDGQQTELMKGAALVRGEVLYKLIYLAPKKDFDEKLLEQFVDSFKLTVVITEHL